MARWFLRKFSASAWQNGSRLPMEVRCCAVLPGREDARHGAQEAHSGRREGGDQATVSSSTPDGRRRRAEVAENAEDACGQQIAGVIRGDVYKLVQKQWLKLEFSRRSVARKRNFVGLFWPISSMLQFASQY